MLFHRRLIFGENDFIGTEPQGVLHLVRRGGKNDDVRAERLGQFQPHVSESAKPHDAHFLPLRDTVISHRRVGRDAGTEERRSASRIKPLGDSQNKGFVHHDAFGISAEGGAPAVFVGRVVSENGAVLAELFEVFFAIHAGAARIDEAADPGEVAFFEVFHLRSDLDDTAHDLMPRDAGIGGALPLVAHCMHIRVANTAKENLDPDIPLAGIAAVEAKGGEWCGGRLSGVGVGFHKSVRQGSGA